MNLQIYLFFNNLYSNVISSQEGSITINPADNDSRMVSPSVLEPLLIETVDFVEQLKKEFTVKVNQDVFEKVKTEINTKK